MRDKYNLDRNPGAWWNPRYSKQELEQKGIAAKIKAEVEAYFAKQQAEDESA